MQHRTFGRLDFQVSALGFGAMRLPTKDQQIDEPEATRMIYYALDHGVNYIDTAYPYHGGQSEVLLGKILKNGYREKVKLATKMPVWKVEKTEDYDTLFEEQLQRLQTEYIDFYLLHSLGQNSWTKNRDLGVLEWAERQMKAGRIRYFGFSFHDKPAAFPPIVDAYDWTFCQVQYNYMDIDQQAGTAGVQYAASKGLAVIVMEPLLGGRLVDPPPPIQALWNDAEIQRSPAAWALQWIWNQPEVTMVLSGMSTMPQVQENVASAAASGVNTLTAAELVLIEKVREQYKALAVIPCTQCEYCLPCPSGVAIPRNFAVYNSGLIYGKPETARQGYNQWTPPEIRASMCTQCKVCEERCPQQIPISQWMPIVHQVLGEGQPYQKSL